MPLKTQEPKDCSRQQSLPHLNSFITQNDSRCKHIHSVLLPACPPLCCNPGQLNSPMAHFPHPCTNISWGNLKNVLMPAITNLLYPPSVPHCSLPDKIWQFFLLNFDFIESFIPFKLLCTPQIISSTPTPLSLSLPNRLSAIFVQGKGLEWFGLLISPTFPALLSDSDPASLFVLLSPNTYSTLTQSFLSAAVSHPHPPSNLSWTWGMKEEGERVSSMWSAGENSNLWGRGSVSPQIACVTSVLYICTKVKGKITNQGLFNHPQVWNV